jgi:hypothetical protein
LEKLNLPTPLFEALKSSWVEPRAVDDDDMTKLGNFQIPRPIPIINFFFSVECHGPPSCQRVGHGGSRETTRALFL